MTTQTDQAQVALPLMTSAEVDGLLRSTFPKVFAAGTYVPLRRRVHKKIEEALKDTSITQEQIKGFLSVHCTAVPYLQCLIAGADRKDLNGYNKGIVGKSEAQQAIDKLKELGVYVEPQV